MLHTVIFIGRSGCGKGTQADLLRDRIHKNDLEKRHILYVETGERFRQYLRSGTFSANLSNRIYEDDLLQPGFLGCYMWSSALLEELEDNMHLMLDGVARTKPEAEMLTTALRFYARDKPTVIHINVSRDWSERHLLARGRSDDRSIVKIAKRLNWFDKDVVPAIEYFKSSSFYRYIEINGEQPIEKVHMDIIAEYDYGKDK
jgi:adenylate kinase family enzyme